MMGHTLPGKSMKHQKEKERKEEKKLLWVK
jgi:hypothetical protein